MRNILVTDDVVNNTHLQLLLELFTVASHFLPNYIFSELWRVIENGINKHCAESLCCVSLRGVKYVDIYYTNMFLSVLFFPWYDLVSSLFMPFVLNSVCSWEFLSLFSPWGFFYILKLKNEKWETVWEELQWRWKFKTDFFVCSVQAIWRFFNYLL